MTIPTDATHEASIHDLDVVRVDVRMSALEPGLRTLVEKLSQELHEARARLYNARQSRDEYLDELEEIRRELGAGPGVTALEAVRQAQKEAPRLDGDEWARAKVLDDIRAALGTDARGPGLVGAVRGVVAARASAETRVRDALERGASAQVEAETMRQERDEATGARRGAGGAREGQRLARNGAHRRKGRDRVLAGPHYHPRSRHPQPREGAPVTPAELVALIRSSSSSDRALELLAEHDRKLVAMANASEAAAVAFARQSRAAEISAALTRWASGSGPRDQHYAQALRDAALAIGAGPEKGGI